MHQIHQVAPVVLLVIRLTTRDGICFEAPPYYKSMQFLSGIMTTEELH